MGRAWIFGDNLNTDQIIPGRYNITIDPRELAKHVFCEIRPEFAENVRPGDIIVGGLNFGCGSSREHAPIAIKGAGVKCVAAISFGRIFFRNAINIGLPILEVPEITTQIHQGDEVDVDLHKGLIFNLTTGETLIARPLPKFVLQIAESGGIINFLKTHNMEELL